MTVKRFAVLLVKNGLLVAALLLTAGVSAVTTMLVVLRSQEVTVPSLLERRIHEAGALLTQHGLLLRVEGRRHDPRIPRDRIAAQDPLPGSNLKAQRAVRVWLSLGPRRLTVPAVEGESLRTARITLDQAQVPLARVVEVTDPSQEGTILVQHPHAGETDALGEGMSILVSRGRGGLDYLMPDLIGRRAEEVLEQLRQAGLKVSEVRYRSYPGVAPGIVLRQIPAAGRRVSQRTSVSLDISKSSP